ncbi:tetratricopeptide repeat protein [Actinosynnema sp. NPDC050801]|uniref:tetratricopeptide repeat protein n=1 Tax=unclassified Actinosynnema TaxID=2637065 RepID=UPI0033CD58CA
MTEWPEDDFYVGRAAEADVLAAAHAVGVDGRSRALLVHGPGGVGKTRMVRALSQRSAPGVVWLPPVDVDDSEFWPMDGLQEYIANRLDPECRHFTPYLRHLSWTPDHPDEGLGADAVFSRLRRARDLFVECYRSFVRDTGTTVVITLDTVEAAPSRFFPTASAQWMKRLPGTLFVLSGRPGVAEDPAGAIADLLREGHDPVETTSIGLTGFTDVEVGRFFDAGPLRDALGPAERTRIALLTEGHPLWLALTVQFLVHDDAPAELTDDHPVDHRVREAFRRRLLTPYRGADFWVEAIRRLVVVRHGVSRAVWTGLMSDRSLPEDIATWEEAWRSLLTRPWIRPRANHHHITLHDALAEELAQRLLPLDDHDGTWRAWLWRRASDVYGSTAAEQAAREGGERAPAQARVAELRYRLLVDSAAGAATFLAWHDEAIQRHDVLFVELLCHEVERFLPGTRLSLNDSESAAVLGFRQWLRDEGATRHLEIALRVAAFLTDNEQPAEALELLADVPGHAAGPRLRGTLANLRGNACLRLPERVVEAEEHFRQALRGAADLPADLRATALAHAHKELGFYYRNVGRWADAEDSYSSARDALVGALGPGSDDADREEMASIQTNWAYLKALRGSYREAHGLIESAIAVRRRLDRRFGVALSLSVQGEVNRYDEQFLRAWNAYEQAEDAFQLYRNVPWLGLIHQQQAICLFQAHRLGVDLVDDPMARARELITRAVGICRDLAVRSYPTALNRAGRIFGHDDVDRGLGYLTQAVTEARRIGDGWSLSASLVDQAELACRAWRRTGDQRYRFLLDACAVDIEEVDRAYDFLDLRGRWRLLQGHLTTLDAVAAGAPAMLDAALEHYSDGFRMLTDPRIGPHGTAAVRREFPEFEELFRLLPEDVRRQWFETLRREWTADRRGGASTILPALLEHLY